MKMMMKAISISALMVVLSGCDVCSKAEECAKKSGTAFSITECKSDATKAREDKKKTEAATGR